MAFNIFFLLYFGLRFIAANDKEHFLMCHTLVKFWRTALELDDFRRGALESIHHDGMGLLEVKWSLLELYQRVPIPLYNSYNSSDKIPVNRY